MLFSSLEFLYLFLPASLIIYFLTPKKLKNAALLGISLLFYALGEPRYLALLLLCSAAAYIFALCLGRERKSRARRRIIFITATSLEAAALIFFKYFDTAIEWLGVSPLGIALPLGISFYIFQILSYLADVYLLRAAPQRSFVKLLTYITLFPQLVAGPIVRYGDISAELDSRRSTLSDFAEGARLFCIGLSKKVLLANPAGEAFEIITDAPRLYSSTLSAWLSVLFFSLQIYFDFSGYSDMARGLGRFFGFRFPENFNYPYISQSVSEFWRRWHITLSSWLREYVYIPLGGNRRGRARTYLNLLAVWSLTGLWHGAGLNFLLWGIFFFALIAIEKAGLSKLLLRLPRVIRHAYALFFIGLGWLIFAFDGSSAELSAKVGIDCFLRLFGVGAESVKGEELYLFVRHIPFLIISCAAATPLGKAFVSRLTEGGEDSARSTALHGALNALAVAALLVCTAYLVDSGYNPFLYFRF